MCCFLSFVDQALTPILLLFVMTWFVDSGTLDTRRSASERLRWRDVRLGSMSKMCGLTRPRPTALLTVRTILGAGSSVVATLKVAQDVTMWAVAFVRVYCSWDTQRLGRVNGVLVRDLSLWTSRCRRGDSSTLPRRFGSKYEDAPLTSPCGRVQRYP